MHPLNLQIPKNVQAALQQRSPATRVLVNQTDDELALYVYGEIGDGERGPDVTVLARLLDKNRGVPVNVRINSDGGDVYAGLQLFNLLTRHDAPVTTVIEGIAAGSAALVAQAASPGRREMFDAALLRPHRAECIAMGNVKQMAEAAEWLTQVDAAVATAIARRAGRSRADIERLLLGPTRTGTLMGSLQAQRERLIDRVITTRATNTSTRPRTVEQARVRLRADEVRFGRLQG